MENVYLNQYSIDYGGGFVNERGVAIFTKRKRYA